MSRLLDAASKSFAEIDEWLSKLVPGDVIITTYENSCLNLRVIKVQDMQADDRP